MYLLATTDNTVRRYAVAADGKSFELLDQLDLMRIPDYHDKAAAKAAAQGHWPEDLALREDRLTFRALTAAPMLLTAASQALS